MTNKMYVGNLSYNVTERILTDVFSEYGTVIEAKVITDKFSNQSKGFGFVTMETAEEANKAISDLTGAELEGRQLKISEAKEQTQRRNNSYNNRRY